MAAVIFLICLVLFIWDKFPPATVALTGCVALILCKVCTAQEALSGFTNDIVFIVFGTEIFGIACQESGLAKFVADMIKKHSKGSSTQKINKKIVIIAGMIAAVLSAFLNNQVVCSIMMVICISTAREIEEVDVKNITLPVIYFAILGGQCTLIGAPATLVASSISEESVNYKISMFEFLPMGAAVLLLGAIYIYLFGYKKGVEIWRGRETGIVQELDIDHAIQKVHKKKCMITLAAGAVMLILFAEGIVSVGVASVIGALICLLGGVVEQKESMAKVDWNILIWLGCGIGIANALNKSGIIQVCCDWISAYLPKNTSPVFLLVVFVLATTLISNLIANTTTVIMVLPFALQMVGQFGFNPEPFIIAITMAAGLSILTPLSCGFIGMTMRVGYRFQDYIRYGLNFQLLLTSSIVIMTCIMYKF